jgi:hypothetical protein
MTLLHDPCIGSPHFQKCVLVVLELCIHGMHHRLWGKFSLGTYGMYGVVIHKGGGTLVYSMVLSPPLLLQHAGISSSPPGQVGGMLYEREYCTVCYVLFYRPRI